MGPSRAAGGGLGGRGRARHRVLAQSGGSGRQSLFGLDYKTAMWRGSEENPFHTEVGYWLWDGATGEVLRGFVVPRGITVLAGGTAGADAKSFSLSAAPGH